MKAERSWLIPRKYTENLVLSTVVSTDVDDVKAIVRRATLWCLRCNLTATTRYTKLSQVDYSGAFWQYRIYNCALMFYVCFMRDFRSFLTNFKSLQQQTHKSSVLSWVLRLCLILLLAMSG